MANCLAPDYCISDHLTNFARMDKTMFKNVLAFTSVALISLQSYGASFDCAKASTTIEKTICSDALIGQLDEALGENYKSMSFANIGDGAVRDLKATQKKWMAERNKCEDRKCLVNSYRKRIDEICDYPVIKGSHPSCIDANSIASQTSNAPSQNTQSSSIKQTSSTQSINEGVKSVKSVSQPIESARTPPAAKSVEVEQSKGLDLALVKIKCGKMSTLYFDVTNSSPLNITSGFFDIMLRENDDSIIHKATLTLERIKPGQTETRESINFLDEKNCARISKMSSKLQDLLQVDGSFAEGKQAYTNLSVGKRTSKVNGVVLK